MKIYEFLNRIPFLKRSFSLKVLLIAFVGIHIPLLSVIYILVFLGFESLDGATFFLIILGFTLLATAVTLYVVNGLLAPISLVKESLRNYIYESKVPHLAEHHTDAVGQLMSDTQYTIVQLDSLFKENKEVLTLLSHDLRGSLANIISAASMIEGDEKDARLIAAIKSSAQNQLEIFDRTVNTLKIQHLVIGDSSEVMEIDISQGISEALERKLGVLKQKNITVTQDLCDIKANLPPKLLNKVFANVLDNAIKFSQVDGTVSVKSLLEENFICIEVTDSGVGFDPKHADEIFHYNSPMSRLGTSKEQSSGVGMYLCRKLLEKHGGLIEARSEGEGMGSTFSIRLALS